MGNLIEIEGLKTSVFTVDGVSFAVEGAARAFAGKSSCGKSVTALSTMQLIPKSAGRIVGGEIRCRGENLLGFDEARMRHVRGNEISMIFQEPMTSRRRSSCTSG